MTTKAELRQHFRALRAKLSPTEIKQKAEALQAKLKEHPQLYKAKKIGAYLAINNELDLSPSLEMLKQQGKEIFVPILHPWRPTFWFAPWEQTTRKNKFGIAEPSFKIKALLAPWELDIIFVPALALDPSGHRLGMGKGFYDHSLNFKQSNPSSLPYLMGCAYTFQLINQIPSSEFDIKVNELISV